MSDLFDDRFVSPGGVCMFVPASRAAVHKRMKEGRLTAFCFHVVHEEKTFFGNVRKAKATPFVYIPVSECKAWAKELDEKRGPVEYGPGDVSQEFLVKDPDDRKSRKVRYTDKFVDRDVEKWIANQLKKNAVNRAKEKGETDE